MNIAVIPARGGSKRIPRKNIKDFLGEPIIARSIEAAIKSGVFDKVIVSTDDQEIADVALSYGAEVPFLRPKELADDFIGTNDVVKHTINSLQKKGCTIDFVCCIYATAPFVQPEDLIEGYNKLKATNKSYVFSATRFSFPIQRAIYVNEQDEVEAVWPEQTKVRSQDLKEAYHDAGQFYWGRPEAFLEGKEIFSSDSLAIVLPMYRVQDIDTNDDWARAELMYKVLLQSGELSQ